MFKYSSKTGYVFFFIFFFIASLFTITNLPYHFQPEETLISVSYDYGFNNRVAMILTLFSCTIWGVISYFLLKRLDCKQIEIISYKNNWMGKYHLIVALLFHSIFVILYMTVISNRSSIGLSSEDRYFICMLHEMHEGRVPYIDFEYPYGILLLYVPYFVISLLHINVAIGYYCTFLLLQSIGILLLYSTINYLNIDKKNKKIIFYAIIVASYPLSLGLNYSLIRFITPVFSLIYLNHRIDVSVNGHRYLKAIVLTVSLILLNIMLSTEAGVVFFISTCVSLGYRTLFIDRKFWIVLLLPAVFFISMLPFIPRSFFLGIVSSGSGGFNWPVIPSPSIVFYLFSLLLLSSFFLQSFFQNKKESILFISLSIIGFGYLPPVLGRCDPGHVFFNGLPVFLITIVIVSNINRKFFKFYSMSFIAVFSVIMVISGLNLYKSEIARQLFEVSQQKIGIDKTVSIVEFLVKLKGTDRTNSNTLKSLITKRDLGGNYYKIDKINQFDKIAIPFSAEDTIVLITIEKKKMAYGYFRGFMNMFTMPSFNRKMSDLRSPNHRVILAPISIWNINYPYPLSENDSIADLAMRKTISFLFAYPFKHKKIRTAGKIQFEYLYTYIRNNYMIIDTISPNTVLAKRRD